MKPGRVIGAVALVKAVTIQTATGNLLHIVGAPGLTLRAFCTAHAKSYGTWRDAKVNARKVSWNYQLKDGDVVTFKKRTY